MQANVVLLIEDNSDDAALVNKAFQTIGPAYNLVHVPTAREAMGYLLGKDQYADRIQFPFPRMVLLDLVLPWLDGFEVLKWIRGQSEIARLPVVVLAATVYSEDVKRAYRMGADSFVTKPADLGQLIDELRLALAYWAPPGREARSLSMGQRRADLGIDEGNRP